MFYHALCFEKGLFLNEENKVVIDGVVELKFKMPRGNRIKIMTWRKGKMLPVLKVLLKLSCRGSSESLNLKGRGYTEMLLVESS